MKRNLFPVLLVALAFGTQWVACDDDSDEPNDVSDVRTDVADIPTEVAGDMPTEVVGDVPTEVVGDVPTEVAPLKARLRALHLSPDAPAVDIFVNAGATPAVTNLAFGNGTAYLDLDAGTYTLDVVPTGQPITASVLKVQDLPLAAGESYTAVAYDVVATIKALALTDDYAGLAAANVRLRPAHTAAGVGTVDVYNVPATGSPMKLWSDLAFGTAGTYLDVPAGTYTVGIDANQDGTPDLTFALPALPAGTVATAYAVKSGADIFLIAQLPDGTTARINPAAP